MALVFGSFVTSNSLDLKVIGVGLAAAIVVDALHYPAARRPVHHDHSGAGRLVVSRVAGAFAARERPPVG